MQEAEAPWRLPRPVIIHLSISGPSWPIFSFKFNAGEWQQLAGKLQRRHFRLALALCDSVRCVASPPATIAES